MQPADLIRMSTQIARFFEPFPTDAAVRGVRDHLEHFWDPAMRKELLAIDPEALHPLVVAAVAELRAADAP